MSLPDVITKIFSAVTPQTVPTNTAPGFRVGVASRGWKNKPRLVKSMADFNLYLGARLATSTLWDWAETFFAEGGSELWIKRLLHADAATAKLELKTGAEVSLTAKAGSLGEEEPGVWGNAVKLAIVTVGSGVRLQVEYEGSVVEESNVCATQAELIAWATNYSNYTVLSLGAAVALPEAKTSTAMTGGAAGTTPEDSDVTAALALIPKEYGPGQISVEGTTETRQKACIAHAVANNRFAVLDLADSPSSSTLITAAALLYNAPNTGRRYAQAFAPWDVIPPLVGSVARTVPPSARACAQYARVDAEGNPNQAAAGKYGRAQFVTDLSQPNWTEQQRGELNAAGITISRRRFGQPITTWGIRNLADQVNDSTWSQAANMRLIMAYQALVEAHMEEFEPGGQIDGFGHLLSDIKGEIEGVALGFLEKGALFGASPADAFAVNVGEALNPVKQLEEGVVVTESALHASPGLEQLVVRIIKVPLTQAV